MRHVIALYYYTRSNIAENAGAFYALASHTSIRRIRIMRSASLMGARVPEATCHRKCKLILSGVTGQNIHPAHLAVSFPFYFGFTSVLF